MTPLTNVNRFEVIDSEGRAYVAHGATVCIDYQDEGQTLKVFIRDEHKEVA